MAINKDKIELFDENGKSRGYYSGKNILNDLTGKEWQYWSKSVINKAYPINYQHKLRNQHGGQKPPELCADIIRVFTKKGMKVLDPFAGVGGTLLGASISDRSATGIELNPRWKEVYEEVCNLEGLKKEKFVVGDSRTELKKVERDYDFLLTDVPYWNMDKVSKKTNSYKKVEGESKLNKVSSLNSFNDAEPQTKEEWLSEMKEVFKLSFEALRDNAYAAVFIGDMYRNGEYHFLSSDLAKVITEVGFTPRANLIWYDVSNRLHIYGYQYEYIPSMIHQNVLIFKKVKKHKK